MLENSYPIRTDLALESQERLQASVFWKNGGKME